MSCDIWRLWHCLKKKFDLGNGSGLTSTEAMLKTSTSLTLFGGKGV